MIPVTVEDFPWHQLRPASQAGSRAAAWVDALRSPAGGTFGELRWRRASHGDAAEVRRRLGERSLARVRVRRGGAEAIVAVPWRVWRALAQAILGDDGELPAPRSPTIAERAFTAAAVADAMARAGVAGAVELGDESASWPGPALLVELAVSAPVAAELLVALPLSLPAANPRSLSELMRSRGDRLPPVVAAVALARGRVARWGDAAPRDVVVVGPPSAALLVGRGAIEVALDARGVGVTVLAPYERTAMPGDDLAHDLAIPIAIVAGDVTMSARALLELAPGQVLSLGCALGGLVELRSGARCLARGELVTIDGELGVRVTELVAAPPTVVATRE